MDDSKQGSHPKWRSKYHIVFAPKYRRQVFYGEEKRAIGEILRKLCEWKGVSIGEAECCPHIPMLLEMTPKMSVSAFVGYLKGKSMLISSSDKHKARQPSTPGIQEARLRAAGNSNADGNILCL